MPSTTNLPFCRQLQDAKVALLKSRVGLRDVPIIGRRKTNLVADINEAVDSLGGIAVVALLPIPIEVNSNMPGPWIEKLEFRFRVIENQALNESKPEAAEVMEEILVSLHQYTFPQMWREWGLNTLLCAPKPIDEIPDEDRFINDVIFYASCGYRVRT